MVGARVHFEATHQSVGVRATTSTGDMRLYSRDTAGLPLLWVK
jgi:hypothetical protein